LNRITVRLKSDRCPKSVGIRINAGLKEGKVKNPHFTLIVPTNKVMPCVPETTVRLVPGVYSPVAARAG
jgi:hypothetical protein